MSVKVRLNPILQMLAGGQGLVEVTGHTTGECLEALEIRFPDIKRAIRDKQGRLSPYYSIWVNSKRLDSGQLTTPVGDGDEIDINIMIALGG